MAEHRCSLFLKLTHSCAGQLHHRASLSAIQQDLPHCPHSAPSPACLRSVHHGRLLSCPAPAAVNVMIGGNDPIGPCTTHNPHPPPSPPDLHRGCHPIMRNKQERYPGAGFEPQRNVPGARGDSGQIHNLMKGSVSDTSKPQSQWYPFVFVCATLAHTDNEHCDHRPAIPRVRQTGSAVLQLLQDSTDVNLMNLYPPHCMLGKCEWDDKQKQYCTQIKPVKCP
ncbi:hypothetical protein F7725_011058 [Dissostichus mawsoni]|uniref:Uncharacterized protein n=1 Tax=Dissostichus mawsoni TaxID=36200 RepID=A0A7J5ZB20_DISMA|nr:hypothetical protein F7725_011058 [Dissostichus mawsoni]